MVGVWCRGGGFEASNIVLEFCLRVERSSKGIVTHFLVLELGFLECADKARNFIHVVLMGTGGVESTGRAVVRFLSELWLNYLRGLKPGILPGCAVVVKSLVCEIHAFLVALVTALEGLLERIGGKLYETVK